MNLITVLSRRTPPLLFIKESQSISTWLQYPPAGSPVPPGYGYPPPMMLVQQKSTNGAAKGCLIALGIGLSVLGVICIPSLIGFIAGLVLIAIGVAIIIVGAVI